jgi:RNA processing factor Prp31
MGYIKGNLLKEQLMKKASKLETAKTKKLPKKFSVKGKVEGYNKDTKKIDAKDAKKSVKKDSNSKDDSY